MKLAWNRDIAYRGWGLCQGRGWTCSFNLLRLCCRFDGGSMEGGLRCIVFSLDYRVDYHTDVFLAVHSERLLFEFGEFVSPAH